MTIPVRFAEGQLWLPIRVTPRGGRDCLLPFSPDDVAIKLKVSSPPEDGKANAAVIKLLASVLPVSKSRIQIGSGEKSRHKQISIQGVTSTEVLEIMAVLGEALGCLTEACFELSVTE